MKGPKHYHSESELFSIFYSRPKTATSANWTSTFTQSVATTRMTTTQTSRTTATSILLTQCLIRQVIGNPHHPCQEISYHTSYLPTFRVDSNKKHVQMLRSHSIKKKIMSLQIQISAFDLFIALIVIFNFWSCGTSIIKILLHKKCIFQNCFLFMNQCYPVAISCIL